MVADSLLYVVVRAVDWHSNTIIVASAYYLQFLQHKARLSPAYTLSSNTAVPLDSCATDELCFCHCVIFHQVPHHSPSRHQSPCRSTLIFGVRNSRSVGLFTTLSSVADPYRSWGACPTCVPFGETVTPASVFKSCYLHRVFLQSPLFFFFLFIMEATKGVAVKQLTILSQMVQVAEAILVLREQLEELEVLYTNQLCLLLEDPARGGETDAASCGTTVHLLHVSSKFPGNRLPDGPHTN